MADGHHHVLEQSTLLKVFGGLIFLTTLTVGAAFLPLGPLEVPVALLIATAKAALVVLYFMALRYDNPVNALAFTIGTIMVLVFITFTLFDTAFRGDLGNVAQQTIEEMDREQQAQDQEEIPPERLRVAPADYPDEDRGADPSAATDEGGS